MNTPRAPKRLEHVAEEWVEVRWSNSHRPPRLTPGLQLSKTIFQGKRDPITLAQQWSPLEDTYCYILITFSETMEEPAATIIERVYHAIATAGILGIPSLQIKVEDLLAWVDGGESGWFSIVHQRYVFMQYSQHN
jgi:hypothetical protein